MSGPQKCLALAIVFFVALPMLPAVTAAQTTCSFKLGFAALRDLIPDVVGECLENERFNVANGNAEQRTTGGLLVWRKADNWTAFTDGATTWINGPEGLASRANDGPPFPWEMRVASGMPGGSRTPPVVPAPGRVLLADDFDEAAVGKLARSSPTPVQYEFAYVEGEFMIRKVHLGPGLPVALLPGQFDDASLAVDARLVGETDDRYISLACRRQADASQYRLSVVPESGRFALVRWDGTDPVVLRSSSSATIRRDSATNRLELICSGPTIAARINEQHVVAVEDSTYAEGAMSIGVSALVGANLAAEARFDNLVVNER